MNVDEIWIPNQTQLQELEVVLKAYLRGNAVMNDAHELVPASFRRFHREYAGLTSKGKKYILCSLKLGELDEKPSDNRFTYGFGAWWTNIRVIFDVENRAIVRMDPT